jgi:hypothetical protein
VRRQTADHAAGTHYPEAGCGPANVDRVLVLGVSESKSESETVGCMGTSWCASFAVVMAKVVEHGLPVDPAEHATWCCDQVRQSCPASDSPGRAVGSTECGLV